MDATSTGYLVLGALIGACTIVVLRWIYNWSYNSARRHAQINEMDKDIKILKKDTREIQQELREELHKLWREIDKREKS